MIDELTFWFGADAESVWAEYLSDIQKGHDAALIAANNCPVIEDEE